MLTTFLMVATSVLSLDGTWGSATLPSVMASDCAHYERTVEIPADASGRRVLLDFGMVSTRAAVTVDGKPAGTVSFPGGELDVTAAVTPGKKAVFGLDVTGYPFDKTSLDFNAPDRADVRKTTVRFPGVTGPVSLKIVPSGARIVDATVRTEGSRVTFVAETERQKDGPVRLAADVVPVGGGSSVRFKGKTSLRDGVAALTVDWPEAKRWDDENPGSRYTCRLTLENDSTGDALDAFGPFSFGVRDVRTEGRDLLLNGVPLHLRVMHTSVMSSKPEISNKTAALETCRRIKADGYNAAIAGNYGFVPGDISCLDGMLEACDETGLYFCYSLPHVGAYDFDLAKGDNAARYRALAKWVIAKARNHPSVILYAMSHNATGYQGDLNPLKIDGLADLPHQRGLEWPNQRRDAARAARKIVRELDPTRPAYHHESGNLDDFHTCNIYLNWAPAQERSDWLEDWAKRGTKPVFFVECGMPFSASWCSYRGTLYIAKPVWMQLWVNEYAAAVRGDAAYEASDAARRMIRQEEAFWARQEPLKWSLFCPPMYDLTNNVHAVQAEYAAENIRALRTWGLTALLPWDQDQLRQRWVNGRRVHGFYYQAGGDPAEWTVTPYGRAVYAANRATFGFVGGADVFTEKDHHFRPGEKLRKQLVIVNDRRTPRTVRWSCSIVGAKQVLRGTRQVAGGGRAFIPVALNGPSRPGRYRLQARFDFGDDVRDDAFAFEVCGSRVCNAPENLLLYDEKGLTRKTLARLGLSAGEYRRGQNPPWYGTVVIGRESLSSEFAREDLPRLIGARCQVLIFEQTKEQLEGLGFRVQEHGLRKVFVRSSLMPLKGTGEAGFRDWNGESTLLPPYLDGICEPEVGYPQSTWAGFDVTRVWRCRNRGTVASVLPEKPSVGDWRPLCDGGFDLQYAPLADWRVKRARVTFCQLDVTDRTRADPVADELVKALIARLGEELPDTKGTQAYGVQAFAAARDGRAGVSHHADAPFAGFGLASSGAKKPAGFAEAIERGGRFLCLGFTAEEVRAWSPVPLEVRDVKGAYFTRIEKLPPELDGLSNADWAWRGAMDFAAFQGACPDGNSALRVVRHGKGVVVFWQVPPWKIDAEARPYLRSSKRRAQAMLARLMGNLGFASETDRVIYGDVPVAEDDPYRYIRW